MAREPASKPALPVLEGRRVRLVALGPEHARAAWEATLDEESMRLTGTTERFTREQLEAWCAGLAARPDRADFAITDPATGAFLGEVVLNELALDGAPGEPRSAHFRIALAAAEHFGKGYGTEATRLACAWAFEALGLDRIDLEVYAFNPRALHVYEKLGWRRTGVLAGELEWQGERVDAIRMSLARGALR